MEIKSKLSKSVLFTSQEKLAEFLKIKRTPPPSTNTFVLGVSAGYHKSYHTKDGILVRAYGVVSDINGDVFYEYVNPDTVGKMVNENGVLEDNDTYCLRNPHKIPNVL
jgi:hypothetical protein